ncbi:MAG: BatD family protein [Muribaculaceae bacterium]|nr:BatD family protein [Muribaculaceae bacterium]
MTRLTYLRYTLLAVALLCATVGALAAKVELRVSPRGTIGEGERFHIMIVVSDIDEVPAAPASVPGATILYFGHSGSSSSFVSTNGRTSQTFSNTYALTLKADRKGSYTFGPVTVGGVKSNSVSYTIGDAQSPRESYPQPGSNQQGASGVDPTASNAPTFIGKGNEQLFLRANISKTNAYEQEALVYTVKLYTTYNSIKFIGATDAPKFDGFVIEESDNISDHLVMENYQGKEYATAVIARYIIFPQMTGKLKIIGNKYTVSADAEEYYHDPFFSRMTVRRPVQLHVTPNDLTVDIKPLPLPKPANFSGGVGRFNISSDLPTANVISNQAGSITYTITGEGNLKLITLPDLNNIFPSQIEVFSPTTDVKSHVGSSNVSGSVKFDYSFMPLEAGRFDLPAVSLVYFNPSTGEYETAVSRSYTLDVARGSESSKSQASLAFSSALMSDHGELQKHFRPYVFNFLYWLLWFVIPALLLAIVLIMYRKHIAEQSDLIALRSKKAAKMAKRRLRAAGLCLQRKETDRFYDEMLRAVWGYLGDKMRIPVSELNRDNVLQHLQQADIDSDTQSTLLKLLDDCEFAKYSPARAEHDMQAIYDEGIDTLNRLEEGFRAAQRKRNAVSTENDDNMLM